MSDDDSLPTSLGVHASRVEGNKLLVTLWTSGVVISMSDLQCTRDELYRQIGEHVARVGMFGDTSIDPDRRKEI